MPLPCLLDSSPLDSELDSFPLCRTPHPYHHPQADLPQPSETISRPGLEAASLKRCHTAFPALSKESTPVSDSATDADDEHFLKGLPAPRVKLHKGLRGLNDSPSGLTTPSSSLGFLDHEHAHKQDHDTVRRSESARRRNALARRMTEVGLVFALGFLVASNHAASRLMKLWYRDFLNLGLLYAALLLFYPIRVILWAYRQGSPHERVPFQLPANFDPAPLLYPPTITTFVSILVSINNSTAILPCIILTISSIPRPLIPAISSSTPYDPIHWALSCLPLIWPSTARRVPLLPETSPVPDEVAVLIFPLHQILCSILHQLTTTSLLAAELQLLSISLIALLVLAVSPQMLILKALLWVGGLSVLILCSAVIRKGITLARVPKWRFRRMVSDTHRDRSLIREFWTWHRIRGAFSRPMAYDKVSDAASCVGDDDQESSVNGDASWTHLLASRPSMSRPPAASDQGTESKRIARRHTLAHPEKSPRNRPTHTPSGRRKRTTSISLRPFLKMSQHEANFRKYLYALYLYACILAAIFISCRTFIETYALDGREPIGWGLGYMFGDWPWFRYQVVSANLDRWISLPPRLTSSDSKECKMGWVQHIRHNDFGEANTRLLLGGYWLLVLTLGLVIVFQLKDKCEVDTRRKVFHFTMVGMLLPGTFVDPAFAALALALVLAVFLILDLLRASQLPPLSKPIASFLAPYVDGRDFRGPVVISHIFLLIGCAIPLWLALAALPRTGNGPWAGWEVPWRDVSMVAGVVCVGLGDAAASLMGRRYGHHKWLWGGGKSLEGSAAFAVAGFAGHGCAAAGGRGGGWPLSDSRPGGGILMTVRNAGLCAIMGSLTEAVLTGGNDNVIVPVILWTCVKSLDV